MPSTAEPKAELVVPVDDPAAEAPWVVEVLACVGVVAVLCHWAPAKLLTLISILQTLVMQTMHDKQANQMPVCDMRSRSMFEAYLRALDAADGNAGYLRPVDGTDHRRQ
jgi:hypothetical protein